jgi:hypothetical protein
MNNTVRLALAALALGAGGSAHAQLVFNTTFDDAAINAQFGANATAFKNAFNYATSIFSGAYSDNIHVNITLTASTSPSILGQSTTFLSNFGYTAERNALISDAQSADDILSTGAGGSFTSANPDPSFNWLVTRAQAKALGLSADTTATTDGTITIGSTFGYAMDPNNRAVAGSYDLIGVMMHEISEVMGRIGSNNNNSFYLMGDALRYSGPGARVLNSTSAWFSIDNGNTLIKEFNNWVVNGGDTLDWATSATPDAYDAFATLGQQVNLGEADYRIVDVLGYDRVTAVPLPASAWLLLSGIAGMIALSRRRGALAHFS